MGKVRPFMAGVVVCLLATAVHAQWDTTNPDYITTPDKVAVGSTSAPTRQLEVFGDARVTKDLMVGNFSAVYGRLSQVVPQWVGMTVNSYFDYPNGWYLDDSTRPGWFAKLDSRSGFDRFSIYRIPPGSGLHNDEVELFTVLSNGKVGIGTGAPSEALYVTGNAHVTGNITAGGNIAAKYQDVAEWVSSNEDLAPGTVVVLDPSVDNSVMKSATAYDTSVAGVVSAQPGIILGEGGAAREQVATTGRVRVKVDASAAPIRIGDLLVTSDKPGVAMRSEAVEVGGRRMHQPGTIIGKALEALPRGEGEILVLLSLQ